MEFYAAAEGYNERRDEDTKILRFASFRLAESFAGSKAIGNLERFWPMEKPKPAKKWTKEEYQEIIKRHKLNIK